MTKIFNARNTISPVLQSGRGGGGGWKYISLTAFSARVFSQPANFRNDRYGVNLESRARFLIEIVVESVVASGRGVVWLRGRTVVIRVNTGAGVAERRKGDFIDIYLPFYTAGEPLPWAPNFMVPYAEKIHVLTGLPLSVDDHR